MNAILGITEIQLQNEQASPDIQEAFEKIHNSGYLLLGIINDILDLSKIESGKFELVPVNYDVASLINDTIHLIIMRFDSKPIEFELQLDENIPLMLFGDDLRLKQILNNLLSNAYKYTDRGKVSLSISVENKQALDRITLEICVSDTGHGMTQEQMDNMFTEYMRFNSVANRTTQGTGLGLSITQHLVQMMGGIICVESEPDKGSEFTVRLPQGLVNSGVLGKELTESLKRFRLNKTLQRKKSPQITRKYMPYGSVLVVDDVETNLYVAKGLMTPYGLNIDTAGSGFEAIEKIKNGAVYDIVFMDHFMPIMDGIETVKIIREMGYTRTIVALTANAISGQIKIFLASGFDDFISKPIDLRQLNAVLNKYIRDKQSPEVIAAAGKQEDELRKDRPQSVAQNLAELFVRDAEKVTAVLSAVHERNVYTDEDIRAYTINIHGIKSALANIGETELSAFAFRLEIAARQNDTVVLSVDTPALLEKLHAAVEIIKPKEVNAAEDSNDDMAYLHEKLDEIKTACTAYDIGAAEDALGELQKKTWSNSVKKRLNAISEDLMHSEFEEAGYLAGADMDM
jgi:CheY-like chemotaxis protein/two-component sensor histidine kinase/HPt (histidine-containing phosphotransfer) domain-containing protein